MNILTYIYIKNAIKWYPLLFISFELKLTLSFNFCKFWIFSRISFLLKAGKVSKIILFSTLNLAWSRRGRGPSWLHLTVLLLEMEQFLISFLVKSALSNVATASGAFVHFLQELVNSDKLIGLPCGIFKTSSSLGFFGGSFTPV